MEPMIDIFLEGYEKHTIHGLGHLSSIHHFLGMILQMQYYLRNIFELSKNGGTPIAGWVIMENAIKNGLYTPIILIYYINIYIYIHMECPHLYMGLYGFYVGYKPRIQSRMHIQAIII